MKKAMSGFTIVELVIVIAVIGILASIATVSYSGVQQKARNASRISDLKNMQDALEIYQSKNGVYPTTNGAWRGLCSSFGSTTSYIPDTGIVQNYFDGKLPIDPRWKSPSDNKCYLYRSDAANYTVLAWQTAEGLCGNGDPGNSCNSEEIRKMDRNCCTEPSFAVYSRGLTTSW